MLENTFDDSIVSVDKKKNIWFLTNKRFPHCRTHLNYTNRACFEHADTVDERNAHETDERRRWVTVPLETRRAASIFVRSLEAPSPSWCIVAKNHSRWRWFLSLSLSLFLLHPCPPPIASPSRNTKRVSNTIQCLGLANVKVHYCGLWKSFCSKVYLSSGPGPFTEKKKLRVRTRRTQGEKSRTYRKP